MQHKKSEEWGDTVTHYMEQMYIHATMKHRFKYDMDFNRLKYAIRMQVMAEHSLIKNTNDE